MSDQDRRVLLLERPVADELHELVADKPGTADEDLLDDALQSVRKANGGLTGEEQRMIADGKAIAMEVEPADIEAVDTLICDNEERHPKRLRRLAQTMGAKLRAARKKARANGKTDGRSRGNGKGNGSRS